MLGRHSSCLATVVTVLSTVFWNGRADCAESELSDYIAQPDSSFSWQVVQRVETQDAEVLELRLHSQTWKRVPWRHRMYIIRPNRLIDESQALLTVTGGRWREEYEGVDEIAALPDTLELFAGVARDIGGIHVVLRDVPFQPLFDLTEDQLIAYTLDKYRETGEADWPLLLPMVKSAVRAMDTAQTVARETWDTDIESFTVIGGSKRGWTTWLAAAADRRVSAIAPIVFDALNMRAHFPHQTEAWGAPSEEIRPYTDRKLDVFLSSEEGSRLRAIIDPWEYRSQLVLPKLIVNASNDAYFPVDSINLYWSGLVGPTYTLVLPNQQHDATDLVRLIPALRMLHRQAAGLGEMPSISWEYQRVDTGMRACITGTPVPVVVRIWIATSEDRDFRDETWRLVGLPGEGPVWEYEAVQDPESWTGVFAELIFEGDAGRFVLSTTPAVLGPNTLESDVFSAVSNGVACDSSSR